MTAFWGASHALLTIPSIDAATARGIVLQAPDASGLWATDACDPAFGLLPCIEHLRFFVGRSSASSKR